MAYASLYTTGLWCDMNHARTELSNCVVECAATSSPKSANTPIAIADTRTMSVQNVISLPSQSRGRPGGTGGGGEVILCGLPCYAATSIAGLSFLTVRFFSWARDLFALRRAL